jgi:hypothetical protein
MSDQSGTAGTPGNGAANDPGPGAQIVFDAVAAILANGAAISSDVIDETIRAAVEAGGGLTEMGMVWTRAEKVLSGAGLTRAEFKKQWTDCIKAFEETARGDGNTKPDKRQGRPLELPLPEPWPKEVVGSVLIKDLCAYYTTHAMLPMEGAALVLALWAIHTFCPEHWRYTPRLHITSATKRAGKTRVLRLLKLVTCKAISSESITKSSLFRSVAAVHPTLLIDEADIALTENGDLVAILNGGYERGGTVLRAVGDDYEPRLFDTFSPVALAGIGELPGTLPDRTIKIVMHRALRSERPAKITEATEATAEKLSRQIMRWITDNEVALRAAKPDMGDLYNRVEDKWTALYAIAAVADKDLSAAVTKAMVALTPEDDDTTDSLGEQLLADMRRLFDAATKPGQDPLAVVLNSSKCVNDLCHLEGRPWAELPPNDRPLTTHRMARLLQPFHVGSQPIGPKGSRSRGYRRADFEVLFSRHLPP